MLLLHILCGNGDKLLKKKKKKKKKIQDVLINIKFNELHLFAFIKYIN